MVRHWQSRRDLQLTPSVWDSCVQQTHIKTQILFVPEILKDQVLIHSIKSADENLHIFKCLGVVIDLFIDLIFIYQNDNFNLKKNIRASKTKYFSLLSVYSSLWDRNGVSRILGDTLVIFVEYHCSTLCAIPGTDKLKSAPSYTWHQTQRKLLNQKITNH